MIAFNDSLEIEPNPETEPKFSPGQLVAHRRYGYRGVVVSVNLSCKADPEWYWKNNTQPEPNQPWYHVLVDGSSTCTYAAETSLKPDPSAQPIEHPFLSTFFEGFHSGRYLRNDTAWPA